eukprot:COSAG05_NODE_100_length_19386_cov_396.467154_7_plen_64_part_00
MYIYECTVFVAPLTAPMQSCEGGVRVSGCGHVRLCLPNPDGTHTIVDRPARVDHDICAPFAAT